MVEEVSNLDEVSSLDEWSELGWGLKTRWTEEEEEASHGVRGEPHGEIKFLPKWYLKDADNVGASRQHHHPQYY